VRQTEPVSALDRSRPFVGWSGLLESGPIGTLPPVISALLSEPWQMMLDRSSLFPHDPVRNQIWSLFRLGA